MADTGPDADIRAFLEGLRRDATYSEMATACRERFGVERAWSRSTIARYWRQTHPIFKGTPSPIESDAEVQAFLDDRLGRLTFEEIAAACRRHFGADRAPSRSAIHRYWKRVRSGSVVDAP